jgi:large subunit ribosomal protein L31e
MDEEKKEAEQKAEEEQTEKESGEEPVETAEDLKAIEEAEEIPEEETEGKKEEVAEEVAEEAEKKPVEEEEKAPAREEKKEEEEIVEERIYTIPLGKAWIMPPRKRAPRAMRMMRAFVNKHMKLEARKEGEEEEETPAQLIVSNEVNQKVWERGIEKPPRKIRVRAAKDKEGNVTVYLAEGD